jgi:hypothetical protein
MRIVHYGAQGNALLWMDLLRRRPDRIALAEVVAFIQDGADDKTPPLGGVPVIDFACWRRTCHGVRRHGSGDRDLRSTPAPD